MEVTKMHCRMKLVGNSLAAEILCQMVLFRGNSGDPAAGPGRQVSRASPVVTPALHIQSLGSMHSEGAKASKHSNCCKP